MICRKDGFFWGNIRVPTRALGRATYYLWVGRGILAAQVPSSWEQINHLSIIQIEDYKSSRNWYLNHHQSQISSFPLVQLS